jgi:hypothetical protein
VTDAAAKDSQGRPGKAPHKKKEKASEKEGLAIVPPDDVADMCGKGNARSGGANFTLVRAGWMFAGVIPDAACIVTQSRSVNRELRKRTWVHSASVRGDVYAPPRAALETFLQAMPEFQAQMVLTSADGTCAHQLMGFLPNVIAEEMPEEVLLMRTLAAAGEYGDMKELLLTFHKRVFDAGHDAIALGAISWYDEEEAQAGTGLYIFRAVRDENNQVRVRREPSMVSAAEVAQRACESEAADAIRWHHQCRPHGCVCVHLSQCSWRRISASCSRFLHGRGLRWATPWMRISRSPCHISMRRSCGNQECTVGSLWTRMHFVAKSSLLSSA